MEGAGGEGEAGGLVGEGFDEGGVAVTLVDGAVGGEEVEVVAPFGVPDVAARGAGEDDGEGGVVVGCVGVFCCDGCCGGGGVVGVGWFGGGGGGGGGGGSVVGGGGGGGGGVRGHGWNCSWYLELGELVVELAVVQR